MTRPEDCPQMPLRQQAGYLLRKLRGPVTVTAVARRLGVVRQTLLKAEEGSISLDRLDEIGQVYGVTFRLTAVGPDGFTWNVDQGPLIEQLRAADGPAAPGLAELEPAPHPAPAGEG